MLRIQIGDTVAFRRDVVRKCRDAAGLAEFRGVVTGIANEWLFLKEASGRTKVMSAATVCKVQRNGAILELV
jgi:hypothetical protein